MTPRIIMICMDAWWMVVVTITLILAFVSKNCFPAIAMASLMGAILAIILGVNIAELVRNHR